MSRASQDRLGNTANTPIPEWILAPHEEKEIRRRCQVQAEDKCFKQFLKMGACAENHQFLFSWKCSEQKKDLLDCIATWGGEAKLATIRDEYILEKKAALKK